MLSNKILIVVSAISLLISCVNAPLKIVSAECGSDVSMTGAIATTSLTYTFKPCTHCRSPKDVCNYIYFQGDTLCFSIQCNQNIEGAVITAYFENPITHATYKVERIEKIKNTVYGFSLVGSLLEKIYFENIKKNYLFKTISFPFVIHITIKLHNQNVQHTLSNTMSLHFAE